MRGMKWAITTTGKYRVVLENGTDDGGLPGAILAEVCFLSMAKIILKDLKATFPKAVYGVYQAEAPNRHRHYHYVRITGTEEIPCN